MDQRVAHILALIPTWKGVEVVVSPLVGGITNQNYRLDIGDESFVLRIGGTGTQLLGIDRGRERTCTALAADVGVGAEVVYFLPSQDALVTRFITGAIFSSEAAAQPAMLVRIVNSLRRYHSIASFPGSFSPFETVRIYHALSRRQRIRACHNDLLASNFIDDGQTIRIIDWEYAGMGDLFFDLGNFAVNQALDEEQCELLLRCYFGEVKATDLAHLHLMRLASDLRESFWGFLQLGISELDFDYHAYAHHHLERFLQNVAASPFEQWLRDVHSL
jgi:aminoglycoside phosphotransferase (APT) family kinase protein